MYMYVKIFRHGRRPLAHCLLRVGRHNTHRLQTQRGCLQLYPGQPAPAPQTTVRTATIARRLRARVFQHTDSTSSRRSSRALLTRARAQTRDSTCPARSRKTRDWAKRLAVDVSCPVEAPHPPVQPRPGSPTCEAGACDPLICCWTRGGIPSSTGCRRGSACLRSKSSARRG